MRHKSSEPLVHLWRRVPRAAAQGIHALAELSPTRALLVLAVTLGFGTGTAVAMGSVGVPSGGDSRDVALADPRPSTISRDAGRPEVASSTVPKRGLPTTSARAVEPRPTRTVAAPPPAQSVSPSAPPATVTPSPEQTATPGDEALEPSEAPTSEPPEGDFRPQTVLDEWLAEADDVVFWFRASESAVYECSLDGAAYRPCESPWSFTDLHPGWHTFAVRAVNAAGNADPTPVQVRWHVDAGSGSGSAEEVRPGPLPPG